MADSTRSVLRPRSAARLAPESLSAQARRVTGPAHREAEATPFVQHLLAGAVRPSRYTAYLRRLTAVYAALEPALRTAAEDPVLAPLLDARLDRWPALESDLATWAREHPDDLPLRSPAVERYRTRLRAIQGLPERLAAHHYVRYLGDLSGGRIVGAAVRRHLHPQADGLAFYDFDQLGDLVAYRRDYRARWDALPVTSAQRTALLDEAVLAFDLSRALLLELA